MIHADPKAALHSGARAAQAAALLRGPPGYVSLLVPVGGDHPKPGHRR
jgi:hypothetical protein